MANVYLQLSAVLSHSRTVSDMADEDVGHAGDLSQSVTDDNKRLQEMLHSALRREAEALRRVKHLSDLLSEYRQTNSGTPSSVQECKI